MKTPFTLTSLLLISLVIVQPGNAQSHMNGTGPVLNPAVGYAAGFGGATQALTADLNNDGQPDLAVINPCNSSYCGNGYGSIAILIGNGNGSFQSSVIYPTSSFYPMSLAVADINGDGAPDLVVASQCANSGSCGTGSVSVFLGNGDGTFQSPVPHSTGAGSSFFVATGDFNRDGNADLAVANQTSGSSSISILLGRGDGSFAAPVLYSTGAASSVYIAVADFDADGSLDLAVVNGNTQDTISILMGNGNGTFRAPAIYASGGAVANAAGVGDFNADGIPDLAIANGCATYFGQICSAAGSVGVLLGNGDGTFRPAVSYGAGAGGTNSIAIADYDGDGRMDLGVNNSTPITSGTTGVFSLLLGNGDGTFKPAVTFDTAGSYASFATAGDFNGDGQPDVAVINQCPVSNCNNALMGVLLNGSSSFTLHAAALALSASVNPAAPQQPVLLTAAITPVFDAGSTTGNVTFYDGSTALTTAPVSEGQASATVTFASAGPHALHAIYSGDSNYAGGTSAAISETVGTLVNITSSANPSAYHQQVTLTATVSTGQGTPIGSVTFMDGSTSLGTVPLVNGAASLNTSALSPAAHSIKASYSGDGNFPPGLAALTQSISQNSTVVLASAANPASTNQPVTFTATVSSQFGGTPTGTIAFGQGTPPATWATAQLVNGQATVTTQYSRTGSYQVAAAYLGDANYVASASDILTQTINGGQSVSTTTNLVTSGSPSYITQPVTFTATVSAASGSIPNGEIVTFYNGANTLGTGTTANGVAMLTVPVLPVGTNSITATYAGDDTYQSSTSKVVKQIVQLYPTTTTVTGNINPSVYGQGITFTVTVTPGAGPGPATGKVSLNDGSGVFASVTLNNGTGSITTSTLAAGTLTITASYPSDGNYDNSSAQVTQVVNVSSTGTSLTSTPNPSSLNQTVTFTATITGQYGGNTGGTVTFKQGSTTLGSSAPSHGKATFTYAFPSTGTFSVTAVYSGDSNDTGSTSAPLNQVVGNTPTTTTLTSSGTPAFAAQPVLFTATVTANAGSIPDGGTVTFFDGAASIGTGTTANGIATLSTSVLAVGSHTMTATYAGESSFQTSTSKTFRQVISLNASTTALTSNINPASFGQAITLTATVSNSGTLKPTGKITFKNGTAILASVSLTNGSSSFTTSKLGAGSLSLSASYSGDAYFASSSGTLSEVVNQAVTTTTLTSTPNPSSITQNVTFTATVTAPFGGLITGSVSFRNGSQTLGSSPLTQGKATLTYAFSSAGTQSITAVYSGDGNNQTSTSAVVSQVVTNAVTATKVTSSGSPATVALPVTFTATVTSAFGSIPDGELVTFYDGSSTIGTGSTHAGAATVSTSTLSVATHNITATYAGDSSFQTSTSPIFKQTISAQSTTTTLTSSGNPAPYGTPIVLTVKVTGAGPAPTGTVTFKNGATPLGTATLNSQSMATYTTVTLGAGSYSITASYNGDASSAKSTSAALNQVVTPAVTTTQLISSVNPAAVGESVTLTALVRSATASPTGSLTFTLGSQVLGTASLINGSAKLSVTTLPAGADTITAAYPASANVAGSSGTLIQYVQ